MRRKQPSCSEPSFQCSRTDQAMFPRTRTDLRQLVTGGERLCLHPARLIRRRARPCNLQQFFTAELLFMETHSQLLKDASNQRRLWNAYVHQVSSRHWHCQGISLANSLLDITIDHLGAIFFSTGHRKSLMKLPQQLTAYSAGVQISPPKCLHDVADDRLKLVLWP